MRKISVFFCLLLGLTNYLNAQNLYENYNPDDTIRGESLILGINNLSYDKRVGGYKNFAASLNANYFKWKFTPKQLFYFNGNINYSYSKFSSEGFPLEDNKNSNIDAQIFGGGSFYLKPDRFYVSAFTKLDYSGRNSDISGNRANGNGYLFGGIGYGRIKNAQGLEAAKYLSEALYKAGEINTRLDKNTLIAIDKIIREYRNGNYENNYKDDSQIYLLKDIERALVSYNVIKGSLDAESTMRIFSVIANTSLKYFYYERYIGFQTQAEIQYQAFGSIKPKENFAKLTAMYGLPVTKSTNIMLSGFYAYALNDDAGMYIQNSMNYYMLGYTDINNFNFSSYDYYSNRILGYKSIIGINTNITQSINSTAGIFFRAGYYNYPASGDLENDFLAYSDLFLQYNVLSKLSSQLGLSYYKYKSMSEENFRVSLGFSYRVF
jgi:hypothetical protein